VITQRYTWRCDIHSCDTEQEEVTPTPIEMLFGNNPPRPAAPPGWRVVDEYIICPKHVILVDDRGPEENIRGLEYAMGVPAP